MKPARPRRHRTKERPIYRPLLRVQFLLEPRWLPPPPPPPPLGAACGRCPPPPRLPALGRCCGRACGPVLRHRLRAIGAAQPDGPVEPLGGPVEPQADRLAAGRSGLAVGRSGRAPGRSPGRSGRHLDDPTQAGPSPNDSGCAPGRSPGRSGRTPGRIPGRSPGLSGRTPGRSGRPLPGRSGWKPGRSGRPGISGRPGMFGRSGLPGRSRPDCRVGQSPGRSGLLPGRSGRQAPGGGPPGRPGRQDRLVHPDRVPAAVAPAPAIIPVGADQNACAKHQAGRNHGGEYDGWVIGRHVDAIRHSRLDEDDRRAAFLARRHHLLWRIIEVAAFCACARRDCTALATSWGCCEKAAPRDCIQSRCSPTASSARRGIAATRPPTNPSPATRRP